MWNYELAKTLKNSSRTARERAISDASAFIGRIKQKSPLIIQVADELIYSEEDGDVIMGYRFKTLTYEVNDAVIVIPVDSLNTIAVIDKVG